MKKIAILGSTGSIGTQTLEVVRSNPDLKVVAMRREAAWKRWRNRFVSSAP